MASVSPFSIEILPNDALRLVLRLAQSDGASFSIALVCKRWLSLAYFAQPAVRVNRCRFLLSEDLMQSLRRFPNLVRLEIGDNGVDKIDDAFLDVLSTLFPAMTHLLIGDFVSHLPPSRPITETGINTLLCRCTRLVELRLHCVHAVDTFPEPIMHLSRLTSLDLLSVSFRTVPDAIGLLTRLRTLKLHLLLVESLPDSLFALPSLSYLYLCCNMLHSLPESLGNLISLTRLHLNDCGMMQTLPASLGHLSALEHLRVDEGNLALPEALGRLRALRTLSLSDPSFNDYFPPLSDPFPSLHELTLALEALPDSFHTFEQLKVLKISRSRFLKVLPESIWQLSSLEVLELSSLSALTTLPASLGRLTGLRELRVDDCQELSHLPPSTASLSSLQRLSLTGLPRLTALPPVVTTSIGSSSSSSSSNSGGLISLRELHITYCNALTHLPPSICSLPDLTSLRLIGCMGLTALPEDLGRLRTQTELHITGCNALTHLPPSICSLPGLTSLRLIGCMGLTALPNDLGRLRTLTELMIDYDGASDSLWRRMACLSVDAVSETSDNRPPSLIGLPESICQISGLKSLKVVGHSALCHLPENIGFLPELETLVLTYLPSLSHLPLSICRLTSLKSLELTACEGVGDLLGAVGGNSELKEVAIRGTTTSAATASSNAVTAAACTGHPAGIARPHFLPDQIFQPFSLSLKSLRFECVSQLQQLPPSITSLHRLTALSLLNCRNLHSLPKDTGQLNGLKVIHLKHSPLVTHLPPSFTLLTSLQELYLDALPSLTGLPAGFVDGLARSLLRLELTSCSSFRELPVDFGRMTRLHDVVITSCRSLLSLPADFRSLAEMRVYHIRYPTSGAYPAWFNFGDESDSD